MGFVYSTVGRRVSSVEWQSKSWKGFLLFSTESGRHRLDNSNSNNNCNNNSHSNNNSNSS